MSSLMPEVSQRIASLRSVTEAMESAFPLLSDPIMTFTFSFEISRSASVTAA
jgi:hypothetical protein